MSEEPSLGSYTLEDLREILPQIDLTNVDSVAETVVQNLQSKDFPLPVAAMPSRGELVALVCTLADDAWCKENVLAVIFEGRRGPLLGFTTKAAIGFWTSHEGMMRLQTTMVRGYKIGPYAESMLEGYIREMGGAA